MILSLAVVYLSFSCSHKTSVTTSLSREPLVHQGSCVDSRCYQAGTWSLCEGLRLLVLSRRWLHI